MLTRETPTSYHDGMESLHVALLDLYREVDAEVAAEGPRCDASGRCCRFKEYGHTLFLSGLEADLLLAQAPPFERPVTAEFCPFQKGTLCTARAPRPLGCRVYFCDPTYQERSHEITEKYLRRLKELSAARGCEWRYAPLHVFLNEAAPASVEPAEETSTRIALKLV
jgi:hypothetical protein